MSEVMNADTLKTTTKRFRLRDPKKTNEVIAELIGAYNEDKGFAGFPASCFFIDEYIAAIRVSADEIAVFYLFQHAGYRLAQIATLITD
ncbi:MAG: hypothetical protein JWL88_168 [Parcubacteria group bacterium]|nr:hypothetical protein [Parcubacteria group bacterium]